MNPPSILQKCLDTFHSWRGTFTNFLVYISFRAYGYEPTKGQIARRAYERTKYAPLNLDKADVEGVFEITRDIYAQSFARYTVVAEKCQTLLRVAALLLTAFGVLLPKQVAFGNIWLKGLFWVTTLLLLNSVTLLLEFFAVRQVWDLTADQDEAEMSAIDLNKCLINNYRYNHARIENSVDFLVNLYDVARFFFLSAFAFFVLLIVIGPLLSKPQDDTDRVIAAIRGEVSLIKGAQGKKGERGEKGKPGDAAKVDVTALINKLLNDKRLQSAIRDAVRSASAPDVKPKAAELPGAAKQR